VGDFVYDETNKLNFGKVEAVDEKDIQVSDYNHLQHKTTRLKIPVQNAVKLTDEQQVYLQQLDQLKKVARGQRAGAPSKKKVKKKD